MSAAEQTTLDEFRDQRPEQCQAIASSTSEQCKRDPIPGLPYCTKHVGDLHDSEGEPSVLSIGCQ
jgi:hypothetical protein